MKILFSVPATQVPFGITLSQKSHKNFIVKYGKQVKSNLSYSDAAKEFGLALMHSLNCDGKLD